MKVGIIVVNYNKKDLLENCLNSLQAVSYADFQILVVDNGSTDGSQDFVREKFSDAVLLEMKYNSGFCKANNVGIKKAFENGCEAIVLLNNDTEVEPEFLEYMVQALKSDEKIGMVAAKVLFMQRKNIIDSCGLLITPDGLAKNSGLECETSAFSESDEVFCPAGAAALYTKELLLDIEYEGQFLDESYGYYFEELDLGWRARLRGWKCLFEPRAEVYHLKSATSGAYSEFIAFYTNRNIIYNIVKNYPGKYAIKAIMLSFARYILLAFGFALKKGPASKIQKNIGFQKMIIVTFRGWKDIFMNLNEFTRKRRYIQGRKKENNAETARWINEMGLSFFDSLYK